MIYLISWTGKGHVSFTKWNAQYAKFNMLEKLKHLLI